MNASEFAKLIKQNQLGSFYIFIGDKDRIKRCLASIKGYQQIKASTLENLVRLYSNKNIFGGKRLIIYEGDDLDEQSLVSLQRNSNNLAIIIMKSIDKRKKIFKSLDIVEFNTASSKLMFRVVDETIGKELDEKLVNIIINRCQGNLGRIENEAHKLKFIDTITESTINELIEMPITELAFKIANAIARKERIQAIELISRLTLQDNPVGLITLIYNQFRNILIIQGYGAASPKEISMKTGLNSNMIYAIKDNIGRYTIDQLIEILKIINKIDRQVKSGVFDGLTAINILVFKIFDIGH